MKRIKFLSAFLAATLLFGCMSTATLYAAPKKDKDTKIEDTKTEDIETEDIEDEQDDAEAVETITLYWGCEPYWPDPEDDGDDYSYSTCADIYTTDADEYPDLYDTLDELNETAREYFSEELPELKELIEEEYESDPDNWQNFYEDGVYSLCRADENLLSFIMYDNFSGLGEAMDPFSIAMGMNIDPSTGDPIDLYDVITSVDDLMDAFDEEVANTDVYVDEWKESAREVLEDSFSESEDEFYSGVDAAIPFTIDYNGVTLYFNGEDTGFDDGPCTVLLSFEEYPDLFEEKYTVVPDSYCVEIYNGDYDYIYWFDFDGDGDPEPFAVIRSEYEDVEDSYTIGIGWGDSYTELEEIGYVYFANAFLFHSEYGDYIYIEATTENDYQEIYVYEINTEALDFVDSIEGALKFNMYPDDEDEPIGYLPVDPDSFKLYTADWTLGNNWLLGDYHVGPDGMPVKDSYYLEYTNTDYWHITTCEDIDAEYVTENSNKSRKGTIEEGSEILPYLMGDDGELLIKTRDDKIWTLELDEDDEGYYTYDDVRLIDLFDGLVFAG
ncbi:MAG: hypothetical protein K6G22_12535 [Lachnospiraceae bacterium]|nr:hypothetical protein [Lachnospiraceae bacterium]